MIELSIFGGPCLWLWRMAIIQYRDTLRCARIRSGAYRPQLGRFKVGNYMYLQHEAPTTLDMKAGRTILRVKEILPSGVLLLEGKDGQECKDNTKNYAPYHLPIKRTIFLELAMVLVGYKCVVCGEKKGVATMLLCDVRGWHMAYLTLPLSMLPEGEWICPRCKRASNHVQSLDMR